MFEKDLSEVFPSKIAIALSKAGYDSVQSVYDATETELKRVPGIGSSELRVIAETWPRDDDCERAIEMAKPPKILRPSDDPLMQAIDLLTSNAASEEIDRRIESLEDEIEKLRSIKKLFGKKTASKVPVVVGLDGQIAQLVKKNGPMRCADLAKTLGKSLSQVGIAVKRSDLVVKSSDGTVVLAG